MHARNARKDGMLEGVSEGEKSSKEEGFEFEHGRRGRLHGEGDIGASS